MIFSAMNTCSAVVPFCCSREESKTTCASHTSWLHLKAHSKCHFCVHIFVLDTNIKHNNGGREQTVCKCPFSVVAWLLGWLLGWLELQAPDHLKTLVSAPLPLLCIWDCAFLSHYLLTDATGSLWSFYKYTYTHIHILSSTHTFSHPHTHTHTGTYTVRSVKKSLL